MEKNKNGFSDFNFGNRGGLNCRGENRTAAPRANCPQNDEAENDLCMGKQLAMVYSPYQHFRMMYSPMDALNHGTLFEELYKPLMEDGING